MGKKNKRFEHESLQDKDAIVCYLKAVIEGFKKGAIEVSDEEDTITLKPEKLANLKIKADQNKNAQSLNIKIQWSSDQSDDFEETPLFIDPKTPKKKKKS
jgi:amphi-Trp domain-containing protein